MKVPEASITETKREQQHTKAAVREILVSLANGLWAKNWKGRSGLTDRSVYVALVRAAWHHGTIIPSGVRVSIAMRQLAVEAGVSKPTACAAIRRLRAEHKLIRRDGRGEGPKCGAFVLLADPRSTYTLSKEHHRRERVSPEPPECLNSARVSLRWGPGRLGKTKELLLDSLDRLGECTLDELAVAMGREKRPHDLRPHLDELIERDIVQRQGNRYAPHDHAVITLHITQADNGELEAEERDRQRYKEESERFREAWERGEVRKKPSRAPARAELDARRRKRDAANGSNPGRSSISGSK